MKLTAPFPVSAADVTTEQLTSFVNDEARPLLRQLRQDINHSYRERQTAVTAGGGAFVTIWTSPVMPTNGAWLVEALVVGVSTSGAAQRAVYRVVIGMESTAGVVAAISTGSAVVLVLESAAAINARFVADAANRTVYLEARDDATSPMRFVAVVTITEALPA